MMFVICFRLPVESPPPFHEFAGFVRDLFTIDCILAFG